MTAGDAPTGLELACRHLPSVILLDLRMPGMDGFGALASLRAHPASAHTPIIVSSANIAEDAREKARALGANLFLPKPLRPNALNKAIEAALGAGVAP